MKLSLYRKWSNWRPPQINASCPINAPSKISNLHWTPLSNKRPCLIDAPQRNYSKILGNSKKGAKPLKFVQFLPWLPMVSTLHLVQSVKFKVRINERWQHKCDPERDRGFWHRRGIIDGRIDMRCQLFSLAANGWIAEEPERWDWTSACKGALLQPFQSMLWSHLAQVR